MPLENLLAISLTIYIVLMFAISIYAQSRVKSVEDFVVAGRRLPVWMASATLLATWFGAGPVLTASTEVANYGVHKAALDPIGAGLCLLIAGIFYAKKLWAMGILTISDFFREKFGEKAEIFSAFILVPSYFGWIAAQFVALAHVLEYFFHIPIPAGILCVAIVGTLYTSLGGMWSVTLTDALQMVLVIAGLLMLAFQALFTIGSGDLVNGITTVVTELEAKSPEKLSLFHSTKDGGMLMWVSIVLAGSLGNIPGQDLMQRVFAAKDAAAAKASCIIAGVSYLILGAVTVSLGLVASYLYQGKILDSILPLLASHYLTPVCTTIFMLAVVSAVLSTIDSAILAPATVLAQNLVGKIPQTRVSAITLNRLSIFFIGFATYLLAISGKGAYSLLEGAYSLTMVGLFVPLTMGLFSKIKGEAAALAAMATGVSIYFCHEMMTWHFFLEPVEAVGALKLSPSLTATACAFLMFIIVGKLNRPTEAN